MDASALQRRANTPVRLWLVLGIGLLLGPMTAYPGNWSDVAPWSPLAQSMWAAVGVVVFASSVAGAATILVATRALLRAWKELPVGGWRQSLAEALTQRRERRAMLVAGALYVVFVGFFLSFFGYSVDGPGIWTSSYPAAVNVLCCGPIGYTPTGALVLTPNFELYISPLVLVTVFGATLLFSLNVGSVVALVLRQRFSSRTLGSTALGAAGGVLVYCPVCGTIVLANVLAGAATAGLLVAWATYAIPLMILSMPLSVIALAWNGQQLSREPRQGAACPVRRGTAKS